MLIEDKKIRGEKALVLCGLNGLNGKVKGKKEMCVEVINFVRTRECTKKAYYKVYYNSAK